MYRVSHFGHFYGIFSLIVKDRGLRFSLLICEIKDGASRIFIVLSVFWDTGWNSHIISEAISLNLSEKLRRVLIDFFSQNPVAEEVFFQHFSFCNYKANICLIKWKPCLLFFMFMRHIVDFPRIYNCIQLFLANIIWTLWLA